MKNNKKTVIIAVTAVVCIALCIAGWLFWPKNISGGTDGVYVQKISAMNGYGYTGNRYSGVVEAQESLEIKKDSSRTVSQILVSEGQQVHVKDALFTYDTTDLSQKITSTNLDIENANTEIEALKNQISDYTSEMNHGGDKVEITARINDLQYSIRQQQYSIQSLQADIARYQKEIDNATIYSTIEGTVKEINEEGGYDNQGNEKPFMTITEAGEYRIKGKISEMGMIAAGDAVTVRSRVDETQTWSGTVSVVETEPATNDDNYYYSGNGESSSQYPFYVSLDSSEGLKLGQHVLVETGGGMPVKEGVWIDSFYLVGDDSGNSFVWVSENGKLKKRNVETGEMDEMTSQIEITSGLSLDDYIAWPDESYTEGMKTITEMDIMSSMPAGE
ncbi:MAG: efflux RND transporter periplasmic adaptor subunit [Bulleidia sp.]|nr:efflux RND transporter periplasmic adaptor subunit [Erysipelotrichaceae bacterium]MDD6663704.1 efflux RND transporter periplasmic adaptor subunit [Bulleidia sp.]MDY4809384.1 efflux RND transporter periplasmic adaptor subunit [Bulleidia sp.]